MAVPEYTPSQFQAVEALLELSSQLNDFVGKDLRADLGSIYIRSVQDPKSQSSTDNPFASLKIEKKGGLKQFFSRLFNANTYSIAKVDKKSGQVIEGSVGRTLHMLHDELCDMTSDVILSILKAKQLDESTLDEMQTCLNRLNTIVSRAEVHNEKKVRKSNKLRQSVTDAFDNMKLYVGLGIVDKRANSFEKSVKLIRASRIQVNEMQKKASSMSMKAASSSDKNEIAEIITELEKMQAEATSAHEALRTLPDQPLLLTNLVPVKQCAQEISALLDKIRVLLDELKIISKVIVKYDESAKIKNEVLELTSEVVKLGQEARFGKNPSKLKKAKETIDQAKAKQEEQRSIPILTANFVHELKKRADAANAGSDDDDFLDLQVPVGNANSESANAARAESIFKDIQVMQIPIGNAINEAEILVAKVEKELALLPKQSILADLPQSINPKPSIITRPMKPPNKK